MGVAWCYRGQSLSDEQIAFLRQYITDHPELSRWKLSRQLCEAWQWKQANGALRDMVCRGLLLTLDRAGEIQLPPVRRRVRNRLAERERPEPVIPDKRPVCGRLGNLAPLEFVQVRRTLEEPLFNSLMEQYHYLGYEQPVGEHLKYLVKVNGQADRVPGLAKRSAPPEGARPVYRMERRSTPAQRALAGLQHALSDSAVGDKWIIWLRTFWDAWRSVFRKTGNSSTRILFIGWKPSWTPRVFVGRVIARPTGR